MAPPKLIMKALVRKPGIGYLGNWLWLPKGHFDTRALISSLVIYVPDSYSPTKVRKIKLYKETEHHILVPRKLFDVGSLPFKVIDCRPTSYKSTGITTKIKLDHREVNGVPTPTGDNIQQKAMAALLKTDSGILNLGCGRGKTILALYYIAMSGGPALILVDNTHLMEQWRNSIKHFLNVPGGIGLIQGKIFDWEKSIVLATYQTMGALAETVSEAFKRHFMVMIFDEAHHLSAATFAPSAEIIYGKRIALTATAERDDGCQMIYNFHVGPIFYKDITHKIKPRIVFRWTGLELPRTADVYDVNGEVHLSKVSAFFGTWLPRMRLILDDVQSAINYGRKVLVLCNSVSEAVNLCALWTMRNWNQNPEGTLYSDISEPTPHDINESLPPLPMDKSQVEHLQKRLKTLNKRLGTPLTTEEYQALYFEAEEIKVLLKQAEIANKLASMLRSRQKSYRDWLTENLNDGGLMIHKVNSKERFSYVKTKQVIFAITKYGREGLDDESLDTVLISTPFSSRNTLQQVLGRPSREMADKKEPLAVIYEDNIGQLIGMCMKMRRHLNAWPIEENGPFEHELRGHPKARIQGWNQNEVFGP